MKYKTNTTQSDLLASNLKTQIVHGDYQPGSRMPTFQEIESNFQVSRGVVQQAIAKLKQDGFVNSPSRRGGYRTLASCAPICTRSYMYASLISSSYLSRGGP